MDDLNSDCDSVYHSCDDCDTQAPDNILTPFFIGSTKITPHYPNSELLRTLLCINAARILLAETLREGRKPGSLEPFEGEGLLQFIVAEWARWNVSANVFASLVDSPIFQFSLEVSDSETHPCSQKNIRDFIRRLQDGPSATVICGQNDTLTIVCVDTSFIVFNPHCRASVDMQDPSLRYFPTAEQAVKHVYNIMAIYRGAESESLEHLFAGYIVIPSDSFAQSEAVAKYQESVNKPKEQTIEKDTSTRTSSSEGGSQNRLSQDISTTHSHPSTAPTSRDTLWSAAMETVQKMSSLFNAQGDNDDLDLEAAYRLQAQMDAEKASIALAIQLTKEEEAQELASRKIPTPPPSPTPALTLPPKRVGPMKSSCSLCRVECEEDQIKRISICGHLTCRICLRQHVGASLRASGIRGRGLIPCPVCQPDQPNKGVVLQTITELVC